MVYTSYNIGEFKNDYSLKNQMRSASISVMSKITEGFERHSPKEFQNFLSIARGTAADVRSQIYLAKKLGYLTNQQSDELWSCAMRLEGFWLA